MRLYKETHRLLLIVNLLKVTLCLYCNKTPNAVTLERSQNIDRYYIAFSGNPDTYTPGEQYTILLKGKSNTEIQYKFKDFLLVAEQELSEKGIVFDDSSYDPSVGTLQLYGDTLTKFSERCHNAVEQTNSLPKSEIQVLWLAPPTGSGCIAFKAVVVESNETWFSEDGSLTKILCEETQENEDVQPNILKRCCACDEAKYESNHIRTIIKARGISYPNITGKTFAVFRVDNKHHLMSLVSMIDPSPDWIVGVSSLELCLRNCSWVESRILNLYPWDAGTDDGITYISPNQPSTPRQPIKRITSSNPNNPKSPFFDLAGAKMKPLARLYLTRQRLYEKMCDPSNEDYIDNDNDNLNCETDEWSEWSPCSATCGKGVKYKQRRYKNEESKYICHKKLTERASCTAIQKYCPIKPRQEVYDPLCELGEWSKWSSCSVTCGKGTKTRDRKYKNRIAAKTCAARRERPPKLQENLECIGESTNCEIVENKDDEKCLNVRWSEWSPCSVTCGKGFKERYKLTFDGKNEGIRFPYFTAYSPKNQKSDKDTTCQTKNLKETVECYEKECVNIPNFENSYACSLPKEVGACKSNLDRWYFDNIQGKCDMFSYSGCEGNYNNFESLEDCMSVCSQYQQELLNNRTAQKRQLDVTVSEVLSYIVQNDGIAHANCVFTEKPARLQSENQVKDQSMFKKNLVDCLISKWSEWSTCMTADRACGEGFKIKHRHIITHPQKGGKPCPKKMMKKRKCNVYCPPNYTKNGSKFMEKANVDCVMSQWSEWSPCHEGCFIGNVQTRTRVVLVYPKGNGTQCPNHLEERPCACP